MAHELYKLTEKLCNKPQLIKEDAFSFYLSLLEERNSGIYEAAISLDKVNKKRDEDYHVEVENGYAVLSIEGPLTYQPTFYQMLCGGMSYSALESEVEAAISQGAKTIILDVDSPGGEAYGCFETARRIRTIADENDVELVAYIDGVSASAAYALTSAAHKVVMNPDAEAGSIGVVTRLFNSSKADKKNGYETIYVFAGKNKIPYDKDGNFKKEFIDGLQQKVDKLYEKFVNHVVEMRGIDEEVVKGTEADMYMAEDALALGLVDSIMTKAEFYESLPSHNDIGGFMPIKTNIPQAKSSPASVELVQGSNEEKKEMTDVVDNTAALSALEAKMAALEEANKALQAKAEKDAELLSALSKQKAEAEAKAAEAEKIKMEAVKKEYNSYFTGFSFIHENERETLTSLFMACDKAGLDVSPVKASLEKAKTALSVFAESTPGLDGEGEVIDAVTAEKTAVRKSSQFKAKK